MKQNKLKIETEEGFTEEVFQISILALGELPEQIELSLEDYLELGRWGEVEYRPDGAYYKGIRLIVEDKIK